MNNELFLKELDSLLVKYNIFLQGTIKVRAREDYKDCISSEQTLDILDVIDCGYAQDKTGPFLKTSIKVEREQVIPHEREDAGYGVMDAMKFNTNKKIPGEFKSLINHINKTHKGVGGF